MKCSCKRGVMRDNCPECEGTGERIDFAALRARYHFSDGKGKDAAPAGHPAPGIVGEEDYPPEWGIWRRTREEGGEGS